MRVTYGACSVSGVEMPFPATQSLVNEKYNIVIKLMCTSEIAANAVIIGRIFAYRVVARALLRSQKTQ